MSIHSISVNNARLTEGKTFPFKILKKVELGVGENYWVLEDPFGYKVLLPAEYYTDYGFSPGQNVDCRIDKINCNGRMFLEPRHPDYEEGKNYHFPVVNAKNSVNLLDEPEHYYIVQDNFGKLWPVRYRNSKNHDIVPGKVFCKVERIKKGKLFLKLNDEQNSSSSLVVGNFYTFLIIDERYYAVDCNAYYILKGPDEQKHILKKKYYLHYNLKKGQAIRCRVDKFTTDGFFLLEPDHPYYETGVEYDFDIVRLEELVFSDGYKQKVLVLKDYFNEEVKVQIADSIVPILRGLNVVKARVVRIRKSRPELEIIIP